MQRLAGVGGDELETSRKRGQLTSLDENLHDDRCSEDVGLISMSGLLRLMVIVVFVVDG